MARDEARIFASIWKDEDFRKLPPTAQRLYFFLISQPDLSYCGVIPLRVGKWARSAAGLTTTDVLMDLKVLAESAPRPFIILDEETEEVFVRSLIRNDGIWKQPNLMKAARQAAKLIESPRIREALVEELKRIPIEKSDSRLARKVLAEFLEDLGEHPDFPTDIPSSNPSGNPSGKGSDDPSGNPSRNPSGNPSGDPSADPSQGKGERGKGKDFLSVEGEGLSFSSDGDAADVPPELAQAIDRVCEHLAQRIIANGCKPPRITKKWRDAARLMMTVDGRTEQQIHAAIDWCQSDEFWRSNVLSMPKLREKYEQLRLQAAAAKNRAMARHQAPPTTSPRNRWMERE